MKKYLILFAIPTLFSCNSNEKKLSEIKDSLSNVNSSISNELKVKENLLSNKEAALTEFVLSFNEIQGNLNEIKAKEKIITTNTTGKDINKSNKEEIIADIQSIYDLLDKNKKRIAGLNKKLKDSNFRITEIELAVNNLKSQLSDKESEITDLKRKLQNLKVDFANLTTRYVEEQELSDLKTQQLNTAYYVIGSKKDLSKKGVITKKGGFIGLGKVVELNTASVNGNYFTKIDITKTKEITIHGDKVKLVSPHPTDSYKLIEGTASIDKIIILDPEKFWKTSKYLIITSEK